MTDFDGELERMRVEARHKLEGERELEERLADYERARTEPPAAVPEKKEEAEEKKVAPVASVEARLAARTAEEAAAKVTGLSTPKLLAGLLLLVFGAWIADKLIGPLVAIAVVLILIMLGYRFIKWLGSDEKDEPEDPSREGDGPSQDATDREPRR